MSSAGQLLTVETAFLAASLGAAIVYGFNVRQSPSIFRTVTKTASTALLSALVMARDDGSSSMTVAGALALGALGDAFLACDDGNGDAVFLGGLSSFLVAHLLYIAVFLQIGNGSTQFQSQSDPWRLVLAVVALLAVPAINAAIVPGVDRGLRLPIMVYSAVICGMTVSALTVVNAQVVSGALLFTTSDAILALERFRVSAASPYSPWMRYAVWALYYSGQLLIATGLSS